MATNVTAVTILKHNGSDNPLLLGVAYELSTYSMFQRQAVKEFVVFTSRTTVSRAKPGQRLSVQQDAHTLHIYVKDNGLAAVIFVNKDYVPRAAFSVLNNVLQDFEAQFPQWSSASTDQPIGNTIAESAVKKYQDPIQADKLMKIQKDLDDTKVILHQTIESVLDRGEKIDNLVEKTNDLSYASKAFYTSAKKTNSCCKM